MKPLLGHVLLAFFWVAFTGHFTLANLGLGLLIGFAGLWLLGDALGSHEYTLRVRAVLRLALLFAWEATRATLRVAHDVVTPRLRARPAILAVPLDATTDLEILLLNNLITLTPGSVVVEVDEDRQHIYVYNMYVDDPETERRRIKSVFERSILNFTRPRRPADESR